MPDRDNENKFMAMLEKMGMVRKLDSDDEPESDFDEPEGRQTQPYDRPEDDFPKNPGSRSDDILSGSFSSAHQPVPGMQEPVIPPEKPRIPAYQEPESFDDPVSFDDPGLFEESEQYEQPHRQSSRTESVRDYNYEQAFWDEPPQENKSLPIEAYTDRFLETDELYSIFSMKTSGTDTVYLIEDYLKSLPDSLPDESRRDIIIKIIAASGFNYDGLMGDGVARVGKLKEYAEQFAQRTEEYVASRSAELESLERQILKIRGLIERRRELHKKQFFSIEAEAQRLKDLLSFLSD